jgi:hypothetical protein
MKEVATEDMEVDERFAEGDSEKADDEGGIEVEKKRNDEEAEEDNTGAEALKTGEENT